MSSSDYHEISTTLTDVTGESVDPPAVLLRDGAPIVFSNQTSPEVKLRDAVMASAAAPTMFPAVSFNGELHADGAIVANAPDLLALELALRTGAKADEVSMLSLGSMNACPPLGEPADPDMGVLDWLRGNRIFRTIIGAQAEVTSRLMSSPLGERYTRIDADPGFPLRGGRLPRPGGRKGRGGRKDGRKSVAAAT